tara:strand:+ start:236 stop:361 length:126 start_codon:yes stop_codon:yes gene_type:complete
LTKSLPKKNKKSKNKKKVNNGEVLKVGEAALDDSDGVPDYL